MEIFSASDGPQSYRLSTRFYDERNPLWLENDDGEGMSLSEANLFEALDQWFKANF
jgi:hypothetical protein